jgi:phosphoribosyl-ATP pyrophosphohydrolase/phosphoribosyl-AMP cyclohydrolase
MVVDEAGEPAEGPGYELARPFAGRDSLGRPPAGPACHLGTRSCFTHALPSEADMETEHILAKLWATIESRRSDPTSYTGALVQNPFNLRNKVIQEAYELLEAHQARLARLDTSLIADDEGLTGFGTKRHMTAEAADVFIHLYILFASIDVTPNDVYAVLERRHAKWASQPVAD